MTDSQAYQLKTIKYQGTSRKVLLQNENGPCPLLAAANALLLRGVIALDPVCVRNGVAGTDDVVNMLANRALTAGKRNESGGAEASAAAGGGSHHEYHLNEVLGLLPNLQHGMDVNPKFTSGPTGVEYTTNLAAFDLLGVELVHGWLLDPQDVETVSVVESKTYNELIETVIHGNEARDGVQKLEARLSEKTKLQDSFIETVGSEAESGENAENDKVSDDAWCVVESSGGASAEERSLENTGNKEVNGDGDGEGESSKSEADHQQQHASDNAASTETAGSTADAEHDDTTKSCEGESDQTDAHEKQCIGGGTALGSSPDAEKDQSDTTNSNHSPKLLTEDDMIALQKEISELREKLSEISLQITRSVVANAFLTSSGHQLTYHGLERLHDHMGDDTLCVFFRNNHFATLTKHDGVLYLLVTDLGYANTPEIVWEKLDNIDGDTSYANEFFRKPPARSELTPAAGPAIAPGLLLAQRSQAESDYQLALAMSKGTATSIGMDDDEGKLIEAAKELSLKAYHGDGDAEVAVGGHGTSGAASEACADSDLEVAMEYQRAQQQSEHESEQLARQLQELEYARQGPGANPRRRPAAPAAKPASATSSCVVS